MWPTVDRPVRRDIPRTGPRPAPFAFGFQRSGSGFPLRRAGGGPAVRVTPGFCLLLAWFAAANGWGPLLLVLTAAAVHEAGHLLALSLCRGAVRGITLSVRGAALDIDSSRLSYGRELLCVLAGPAANGLLCLWAAGGRWDALAGASLLLGLYNLLPVRPLDGGRAVELAVSRRLGPAAGEWTARICGGAGGAVLAAGTAWLMVRTGGTLWLLPPLTGFLSAALRELGHRAGTGKKDVCGFRSMRMRMNYTEESP